MKHRGFLWLAIPLYTIALSAIGIYLWIEFKPRVLLNPAGRLALMSIFCLCSYLAGRMLCKLPQVNANRIMKLTFIVYFLCYFVLLLTFTLFDPMFGRHNRLFSFFTDAALRSSYMESSFNIVPFRTITEYVSNAFSNGMNISIIVTNLLGNLVALMPMALFLPLLFYRCRKILYFLLTVAGTVVIIEVLQLILTAGACDIDDLILNTGGACIAFLFQKTKPCQWLLRKWIPIE